MKIVKNHLKENPPREVVQLIPSYYKSAKMVLKRTETALNFIFFVDGYFMLSTKDKEEANTMIKMLGDNKTKIS